MPAAEIIIDYISQNDEEVKNSAREVADEVEKVGSRSEETAEKARKLKTSYSDAASGLSAAATSAYGLYTQYDYLEKTQLRVAVAEKNIDSARASLLSSQQTLNDLTGRGITSGSDYEASLLRVQAAEQQLSIAQEKAEQAQQDVNQSYVQFAVGIAPTVVSLTDGLTKAKTALAGASKAHFLATVQNSLGLGANTAAKATNTAATVTATGATQGLTLATRLLQIAMGPVGWALLGMGAVMGLVATNTFGLRDAFAGFFGALPEADAATDGARTAIDGLGASATGARDRAAEAQQDITKDMGTLSSNVGSSVETSKAALVGLQNQFSETSATSSSSMANLAASTSTHASSIESAAQRAEAALARLGGLPSNIQLPAAGTPFNAAVPALQAQMMDPAQIPAFKEFLAGYDSKKQVLLREKATNQAILDRPWESAYNRSNARKRIAGIDEELAGLIDRKNYAEQQLAIRDYLMTQLPPAGLGETATIRDSITVELKLGDQALERVTTEVDRRLARRR